MKEYDFISQNIGKEIYITGLGDLSIERSLRPLINQKTKLILIKLTKGGMAYLQNPIDNKYYSVPPKNVRLYSEVLNQNEIVERYWNE